MTAETPAPPPARPTLRGTRHMVAAGHTMAAQAGLQVLEAGGNAVDAAAAAGIATAVLEPEFVTFAGVAPILIYLAAKREIVTISGLGPWPRAASCDNLNAHPGGAHPP
ncbi:MAG: gamma-glutamyltransferase, partial [Rhodospirillales bacterium]|nr:gamma-glutamyltransferase [Rhodospirillales bacterium]